MKEILEIIRKKLHEFLLGKEIELYSVEFEKRENEKFLTILLDKTGSFDFDEIVSVSEEISVLLDGIEELSFKYFLDVSNVGPEKEIKDFKSLSNFIGKNMIIITKDKVSHIGHLIDVGDEKIIVEEKDKTRKVKSSIELADILSINLRIEF